MRHRRLIVVAAALGDHLSRPADGRSRAGLGDGGHGLPRCLPLHEGLERGPMSSTCVVEADGQPSHTIKLAILGPRGGGTLDAEECRGRGRHRPLPNRAPFRWRPADRSPRAPGPPVWVRCGHGRPGAPHRSTHAGRIRPRCSPSPPSSSTPGRRPARSRDRPLWRLWVVDGLDGGRVALVLQLHHALADGAASVRIWEGRPSARLSAASAERRGARGSGAGPGIRRPGTSAVDGATSPVSSLQRLRAGSAADRKRRPALGSPTATHYFEAPSDGLSTSPRDIGTASAPSSLWVSTISGRSVGASGEH